MMKIEATWNIGITWLSGRINPEYGTLSTFIEDKSAINLLFRELTLKLKGFGFIDGKLAAISRTKIKVNTQKNKHYNGKIIIKGNVFGIEQNRQTCFSQSSL